MRPAREARFAGSLVGGANVGKRLNSLRLYSESAGVKGHASESAASVDRRF
jgi:hypothetical protein